MRQLLLDMVFGFSICVKLHIACSGVFYKNAGASSLRYSFFPHESWRALSRGARFDRILGKWFCHIEPTTINILRQSRGYFTCGRSPLLLASASFRSNTICQPRKICCLLPVNGFLRSSTSYAINCLRHSLQWPPFAFLVQLVDYTLILSKGSFSLYIIAKSLLLNRSPSEWFSLYKNRQASTRRLSI